MAESYGQFCPVAQAAELLTERWTPLVIRELVSGSRRFNEIQRGVPLMSSSLLTKRLRTLERAEVIERVASADGSGREYRLTEAGAELEPLIDQMGIWAQRWLRRPVTEENADTTLLMWDMRRNVELDRVPEGRTVVHFRYRGAPEQKRYWWLVLTPPEVDLCLTDPGHGIDLTVRSDPETMAAVWIGNLGLGAALRNRAIELDGPEHLIRAFPGWLRLSPLAQVESRRR